MSFHEIAIAITARDEASTSLRTVARNVASLGASAVAVGKLGEMFGFLSKEQANTISQIGSLIALSGTLMRGITALSKVTQIATVVQNALNISHATFLALTGVGIGVIIAAAAAMAYFSSQMNAATSSVQSFNEAAAETPVRTRGIQRAGEEDLYRRGVE